MFQIDPKTKKSWVPLSKTAIPVLITKAEDGTHMIKAQATEKETVMTSKIVPGVLFQKTAPKFGQWSDASANTLYGLGFGSEADANSVSFKLQHWWFFFF